MSCLDRVCARVHACVRACVHVLSQKRRREENGGDRRKRKKEKKTLFVASRWSGVYGEVKVSALGCVCARAPGGIGPLQGWVPTGGLGLH